MILIANPTPAFQRRMVFPSLEPGLVNRAAAVEELPSGKGINVARAVARLGGRASLVLFLGGDTGAWIRRKLREEGLPLDAVETAAPTRTCTTLVEQGSGRATELVENGAPVEPEAAARFADAFSKRLPFCRAAVCIGTAPQGVPEDFYLDLARRAAERSLPVAVDAQGALLMRSLAARPLLVKPNRHELAAAAGCDCSTDDGLRRALDALHRGGARWVLVTDGPNPATLSDGERLWRFEPPTVTARNPIGSGDSVLAGFMVALLRGAPVTEAARYGLACGTANAAGDGYARFDPAKADLFLPKML